MDAHTQFEHAGWVINQLIQGTPSDKLPMDRLENNGWTGALAAIQSAAGDDRHAAFLHWCADQADGGQAYQAAVFKWKPGDLDPMSVDQGRRIRWTARELMATDFPEPVWTIPGVLPVGLAILAGRPKVGKSWLALQWAHAVAAGGMVFDLPVKHKRVLYLALEDGPVGLKNRLTTQQAAADLDDLIFLVEWPTFGTEGGRALLQGEIEKTGARLVVIDTLSRALGGRADQMDIGDMTDHLGELQKMALATEATILIVDHHRKSNGFEGDPVDDIMGSSAKAAVADCIIGLYKERGKQGATLRIVGRELEDKALALTFDRLTCCWQLLGNADDVKKNTFQAEVLEAIQELLKLGELPTSTRIAKHLDKSQSYVGHTLADLLTDGMIIQGAKVGKEQPYELTHT